MEPEVEVTKPLTFGRHRALDGLRGVAVAAVVLYHFAPDLLPGGFLGVDVFFVLSGFLITSLILHEFAVSRSLSLRGFWTRRVRRLLPASLAMIAVSVALAWWLEPSSSRPALRTQSMASLFYVNNWSAIASGNSYEGRFGRELPLTHFWSLAIEEQFYLLFPVAILLIVLVLRRLNRVSLPALTRSILIFAVLGTVASATFMAAMHQPHRDPSRLYFGTETRVQAILIGVALACLNLLLPAHDSGRRRRLPPLLAIALLILLFASFRFAGFRQDWLYNGGFLAISSLVAVLIWLLVRPQQTPLQFVLHHTWLVGLGLVSYGVYLWHWPARVFLTTERTGLDGMALFSLRILATAVATGLSLIVIERPFRHAASAQERKRSPRVRQSALAAGSLLGVVLLCICLTIPEEQPGSQSVASPPLAAAKIDGPIRVYLIGDSVAWTIAGGRFAIPQPSAAVSSLDPSRVAIWNRARFGLSLLRWPKRTDTTETNDCPSCDPVLDYASDIGLFQPDLVVHSSSLFDTYDVRVDGEWVTFGSEQFDEIYLGALEDLRVKMETLGTRLVLMAQPLPGNYPTDWRKQFERDSDTFPHLNDLQRRFAADHPDVGLIDLEAAICSKQLCSINDASGELLRGDGLHFTEAGATFVAPLLTEKFESLAARVTQPSFSNADQTR